MCHFWDKSKCEEAMKKLKKSNCTSFTGFTQEINLALLEELGKVDQTAKDVLKIRIRDLKNQQQLKKATHAQYFSELNYNYETQTVTERDVRIR
jgi:hypothetical protein